MRRPYQRAETAPWIRALSLSWRRRHETVGRTWSDRGQPDQYRTSTGSAAGLNGAALDSPAQAPNSPGLTQPIFLSRPEPFFRTRILHRKVASRKPRQSWRGVEIQGEYAVYCFNLRRNTPRRPISPVPRRFIDADSGAVIVLSPLPLILVSPLESVVDPLKKPLPVLTVSWTVAP